VAPVCKHMVASMLALAKYLHSEEVQDDWQYKLGVALENAPRRKTVGSAQRYAAIFLLQKEDYYQRSSFSLAPRVVKASQWGALKIMENDPVAINQSLDKNRGWTRYLEQPYQSVNPAGCMNLPPEGIAFFNFVLGQGRYYGFPNFPDYLPMLARLEIPIFLFADRRTIKERVHILTDPHEIKAALTRDNDRLILQAGLTLDDQLYTSSKESLHIVSQNPPWALVGDKLVPVANPESLDILQIFPLEIPTAQEEAFREKYFRQIAERVPVQGDVVDWEDVREDAVPRLYLRNDKGTLRADLRFGYGEYESPAERDPAPVSTADNPGSWTLTRIYRQPEREANLYQLLTDAKYGLKRASSIFPYGTFEMRARTHPFDFLMHSIPALTAAGFEIYGDKESLGKVNPHTPTIRLNITSGIDWFELDAMVQYGDQEVKLREIRKALRRGDKYIKLADGSIGKIPEHWLERYKHLFNMAEETDGGLRVTDLQLSLVDELLSRANCAPTRNTATTGCTS
jgi:non-specific serine/threonine protein kinase